MVKRIYAIATIVLFFSLIWLPVVQTIVPFIKEPPNSERRALAPLPTIHQLTYDAIKSYRRNLQNYFNDNLGFRRLMIQWSSLVKIGVLDMSLINNVIVGENGWLFYNNPKDGTGIRDFLGKENFSSEQLETIRTNLKQIQDDLSEKGIHFLLIIPPNKQSIYPEYLPERIRNNAGKTRLDQLDRYLKENSDVNLLEMRSALLASKGSYPVYLRTDTHWTSFGAYLAYKTIMTDIIKLYVNISVLDWREVSITTHSAPGSGDLAGMLSMAGFFGGTGCVGQTEKII